MTNCVLSQSIDLVPGQLDDPIISLTTKPLTIIKKSNNSEDIINDRSIVLSKLSIENPHIYTLEILGVKSNLNQSNYNLDNQFIDPEVVNTSIKSIQTDSEVVLKKVLSKTDKGYIKTMILADSEAIYSIMIEEKIKDEIITYCAE